MEVWIPVIIAVLTTITAVLQTIGKQKAAKVTNVLVDQVESFNDSGLKRNIRDFAEIHGVGEALHKVVKRRTV